MTEHVSLRSFIQHDDAIGPSDVAGIFDLLQTHAVFIFDEFMTYITSISSSNNLKPTISDGRFRYWLPKDLPNIMM